MVILDFGFWILDLQDACRWTAFATAWRHSGARSPAQSKIRNPNPKSASSHRLHAGLAAGTAAALFAGLLVVGDALDVLRQPFLLARLLEPPDHLLGGLVPT